MHRLHRREFVKPNAVAITRKITKKISTEMFNLVLSCLNIATNCSGEQSFQMACKLADEDCI